LRRALPRLGNSPQTAQPDRHGDDEGTVTLDPDAKWFWEHYTEAVDEIVGFCGPRGIDLAGKEVADVGSGDGIMATGLCNRTSPARFAGYDIVPTDRELLLARCRGYGVGELPPQLEFHHSTVDTIPAPDHAFDFVYSWSAFEHISKPAEMLAEIRRILRPDGWFFLQLWPFYYSPNGSHLWDWFPEPHHHLGRDPDEIVTEMRAMGQHEAGWTEYMVREFQQLNRITLGELQRDITQSGLVVTSFEFITGPCDMTPEMAVYGWADLAIGGIKLLARHAPAAASRR
jgi:ubiquinone/menaquinone biosynthesis C-methylase UbiE